MPRRGSAGERQLEQRVGRAVGGDQRRAVGGEADLRRIGAGKRPRVARRLERLDDREAGRIGVAARVEDVNLRVAQRDARRHRPAGGDAAEQREPVVRDREQRDVVAAGVDDEEAIAAGDDGALRCEVRLARAAPAGRVRAELAQRPVLCAAEGDDLVVLGVVRLEIHSVQGEAPFAFAVRPHAKESSGAAIPLHRGTGRVRRTRRAADFAFMNARRELQRLDLVEASVVLPGRTLTSLRPRSAEALLDEEAFEHEEFLPYWAELWGSGEELSEEIAERDVSGLRVVELGCGLALPSLAAAAGGANVLAPDWASAAS